MFKALLKKQMQEFLYGMFRSKKKDKKLGTGSVVLYVFLLFIIFISLAVAFIGMSALFASSLLGNGNDWIFFALVGFLAFCLGIIGSVFMTYSGLYEAKDNELLLSLPIKPSFILFVRLIIIYFSAFLFEASALIPSLLVYFSMYGFKVGATVGMLSALILLPLLTVAVSCILGWVIALLASRIKSKSVVTVLLLLAFLSIYYVFVFNSDKYLEMLVSNPGKLADFFGKYLLPFLFFGKGCDGSALHYIVFVLISVVLFSAVYAVLSLSFIKLTTTKRTAKKTVYEKKSLKTSSPLKALYKKELSHFFHSAAYMMNGALGSFFCVIAGGAMIIKSRTLETGISELLGDFSVLIPAIGLFAIFIIGSMNIISTPSVSLEGKNIWISNSLPVKTETILLSKMLPHIIITGIPVSLLGIIFDIVFKPDPFSAVFVPVTGIVFSAYCAVTGLWLGLLKPNLEWTSETVAIKSGIEVLLSMLLNIFSGLAFTGLGAVLLFVAGVYVTFPVLILIMAGVTYAVWCWIKTSGAKRFSSL